MIKIEHDSPTVKINRQGLFPGSGMLNTLIHIASHCYFRNSGTVNYTSHKINPVAGEYECDYRGLDFLLEKCNGTKSNESVYDAISHLKDQSLLTIKYSKNDYKAGTKAEFLQTIRFVLCETLKTKMFPKVKMIYSDKSATTKKGFIFIPRNLYLLLPQEYELNDTDALWDIITSICLRDSDYPESNDKAIALLVTENGYEQSTCTYEELAKRWRWKSTSKVYHFFEKYKYFIKMEKNKDKKSQIIIKDELLYSGLLNPFERDDSFENVTDYIIRNKLFHTKKTNKKKDLFYQLCELDKNYKKVEVMSEEEKKEAMRITDEEEKNNIIYQL